jgi:hypothetical protein
MLYDMMYLVTAVGFPPVAAVGTIVHSCTQLYTAGETIQNHGTHKIAGKSHKTRKQSKRKIKKSKKIN